MADIIYQTVYHTFASIISHTRFLFCSIISMSSPSTGAELNDYITSVVHHVDAALKTCGDSQFNGKTGLNEAGFQAMFATVMTIIRPPFGGKAVFEAPIGDSFIADIMIIFDEESALAPCLIELKYIRLGFLEAPDPMSEFNRIPGGPRNINTRTEILRRLRLQTQAACVDRNVFRSWKVLQKFDGQAATVTTVETIQTNAMDQVRKYARTLVSDTDRRHHVYAIVGVGNTIVDPFHALMTVRAKIPMSQLKLKPR